jgi:hypothetical protein
LAASTDTPAASTDEEKTSPFDVFNDGTSGGKKSRSKTRKQKRRKTKK